METLVNLNFLLAFVNIAFGLFILFRTRRTQANLFYSGVILSVGLWSFGVFMFSQGPFEQVRFWGSFLYFFGSFVFANLFAFSLVFPENNRISKLNIFLIYLPNIIFLFLLFFTDLILHDFYVSLLSEREIFFGQFYFLYWLYFLIFVPGAAIILWRKYLKAVEVEKVQIGYVLIGSAVSAALGTTSNLWLPTIGDFRFFSIGPYFSLILVVFIGMAVFRYRLFDIRVIATEFLISLMWIFLLVRTIIAQTLQERIIDGGLLALVVFFGILLIRSVLKEVRQREEIAKLAEDLRKANLELKKLDQLKSEFVSLASHQLRSPLTVIKGYISLIEEGSYGEVSDKLKDVLRKIYLSNEHLINLVADFLNLSRIESGKMKYLFEPAQVEEIVGNIFEEFQQVAKEKKIKFSYEKPPAPLPAAMLDKEKFRQVIVNLVDNALKYTQKGFIRLKVERASGREGGEAVEISVFDSGIGISSEDLDMVFGRFSRGVEGFKQNTGGLGLGLYLAKRIVVDHGGDIWAESKGVNRGSTFKVRIPARAEQVQKEQELKEFVAKI